jgi:alcohol dehydrogenase class IV
MLLVCSKSTRNYFPDISEVYMVSDAPDITILEIADSEDEVIAVGGGAVIDTAKIIAKNKIICYPTTAAGSSATSWSVYWNGRDKYSYKALIPKKVYFDEQFLQGIPQHVIEYTTYDAVSHCLDSLWSKKATPESRLYANQALAMLHKKTSPLELIKAGHIAGQAIEITSTNLLHCLSYPLTGIYNVPHGKALGFLLPKISKWMGNDVTNYLDEFEVELDEHINMTLVIEHALLYDKIHSVNKQLSKELLEHLLL